MKTLKHQTTRRDNRAVRSSFSLLASTLKIEITSSRSVQWKMNRNEIADKKYCQLNYSCVLSLSLLQPYWRLKSAHKARFREQKYVKRHITSGDIACKPRGRSETKGKRNAFIRYLFLICFICTYKVLLYALNRTFQLHMNKFQLIMLQMT